MLKATLSSAVFGVYLMILGLGAFVLPDIALPMLGVPQPADYWVRVVGLFALSVGFYYLYAGLKNDLHYFRMSVIGRVLFFIGMAALALLRLGPASLLLFGTVDLLGALWTAFALRANGQFTL